MHQLLEIALIIIFAKVAGEISERLGQSPILGQIIVGVILGPSVLGLVEYGETVELLSQLGIIFLIFLVGLQTRTSDIREVGAASGVSALGGILVPFLMGFVSAYIFGFHWREGMILGASLTATSMAITSGVLMDLGKIRTRVAEMILTAAVVDDVLGLLILTFVVTILGAGAASPVTAFLLALIFWVVLLPLGWRFIPQMAVLLRRMRTEGGLFVMILGVVFVFAFVAEAAGLAGIVGAFLIGMILAAGRDSAIIIRNTLPLYYFLAPLFFVSIGILFDLSTLVAAPLLVAVVTMMAVAGKILGCGAGARLAGMPGRASIFMGVGMVPRGEVALIIAGFARTFETASGNPLLGNELFSIITGMSMITILITPIILRYLAKRYGNSLDQVK